MIKLKINGQEQNWDGDPDLPLLWFIRDEVGLTGTKFGCGQALCGACTVIMDKQAVRACITSVSDASGRDVTTIVRGRDERSAQPPARHIDTIGSVTASPSTAVTARVRSAALRQ